MIVFHDKSLASTHLFCKYPPIAAACRGTSLQHRQGLYTTLQASCRCSQHYGVHDQESSPPRTTRRDLLGTAVFLGALLTCSGEVQAYIIDESVTERVYKSAAASVVCLTVNKRQGEEVSEEGTGSGLIWDNSGFIVTNYHCIQQVLRDSSGSQFLLVRLDSPGSQGVWEVQIVGSDASHDLAVLKIDAPADTLRPIKIGTSADLQVGQSVFAIGNPFGLSKTLTAGVVSGLNRGIPTPDGSIATGAIQTDAAVSRGNSGGALLDSSGRLVGISTATFSSNKSMGRGSGVNFAISVDTMRQVVPNLIVYGNAAGKGVGKA